MTPTSNTAPNSGQIRPIVFFGTEDFSLFTLAALIEQGFEISAVVTKPDSQQGRGRKLVASPVKTLAVQHGISVLQPRRLLDISQELAVLDQPLGILVSFGKIIPQSLIDLFTPGIINIHPSLLPKYRGPSPIESAILNGDTQTGVTIMQLSAAMDAGPIYAQVPLTLHGKENQSTLYDELAKKGTKKLMELLPQIYAGSLLPLPQDDAEATYCQLIQKSDGVIDWNEPAASIERKIRAYHTWPQSRTTLGDVEVIVTSAHVVPSDFGQPGEIEILDDPNCMLLMLQTGSGYLCIDTLKPVGKKEMPVRAFLAGYRSRLSD